MEISAMSSDVSESTHEMVAADAQSNLPALTPQQQQQLSSVLGDLAGGVFHNFAGSPQEIWRQMAKATGPNVLDRKRFASEAFPLSQYYVHAVKMRNIQTGRVDSGIRCVLIAPDGQMTAVVSQGVARDLALLIHAHGIGPYDPPIEVFLVEVKTRAGFHTIRLQPAE